MNNAKNAKAAEFLAARRARVTTIRRRCTAAVLSSFVLAFGVLTVNDTTSTDATTSTVQVTAATPIESTAESAATESTESTEELAAASTSQS